MVNFGDQFTKIYQSHWALVAYLDPVLVLKQVYAVVHAFHGERDFSQEIGRL